MKPLTLVCAALPLCLYGAPATAEDEIATDRPDFVESSDVVGKGRVQLETGLAVERDKASGLRTRLSSTPTLLRLGLAEDWELRLETEGALRLRSEQAGVVSHVSGHADVAIGVKWHVQDGDEATARPGMAWLLHLDTPTGSRAFRGKGLRPSLRFVAEWEFTGGYAAGVMPGVFVEHNEQGQRYTGALLAATFSKSFSEALRGFVELSGQQLAAPKNGGNVLTFDTGLAYLLTRTLQLDLAASRGLNRNSPDMSWTLGLSAKF